MPRDERSLFILETERLLLRRQTDSDIEFLTGLWSDPEVTCHMGGPHEKDWLRSVFEESAADPFLENYDLWPLVEKTSGLPIGHCGLLPKDVDGKDEIELNYILSPVAWGKGYAVEIGIAIQKHAFEKLGLHRLIALIDPENEASEQVAARIGMHLEKEITREGGNLRRVYAIDAGSRP